MVSDLQNLANNAQEVQNFYDRVHSDIIANSIDGSITKLGFIEGYMNGLMMGVS